MSFKFGLTKTKQNTAKQKTKTTTLASYYSYVPGHFWNFINKYHICDPQICRAIIVDRNHESEQKWGPFNGLVDGFRLESLLTVLRIGW